MIKDFLLSEINTALEKACKENKVGQMTSAENVTLIIEKPKNTDFGDFAVNVSSLARDAKIAPPMIANAIVENLSSIDVYMRINDRDVLVKAGETVSTL